MDNKGFWHSAQKSKYIEVEFAELLLMNIKFTQQYKETGICVFKINNDIYSGKHMRQIIETENMVPFMFLAH